MLEYTLAPHLSLLSITSIALMKGSLNQTSMIQTKKEIPFPASRGHFGQCYQQFLRQAFDPKSLHWCNHRLHLLCILNPSDGRQEFVFEPMGSSDKRRK
jgi:hypothetical protein